MGLRKLSTKSRVPKIYHQNNRQYILIVDEIALVVTLGGDCRESLNPYQLSSLGIKMDWGLKVRHSGKTYRQIGLGLVTGLMLTGCQSTSSDVTSNAANGQNAASEEFDANAKPNSFAPADAASVRTPAGKCAIELAGGPPAKPAKGADFAKNAVGKNLARNVGRNILGNVIGGGAIGATVASQVVRTEQDMGGKWMATDGSNNCGCEIRIRTGAGVIAQGFGRTSGYKLRDAKGGSMSNLSCSNPQLASVKRFALGYSFTGYDATLAIEGKNGAPVAKLKRDGINYFSGNLADGTPVTIWRRGG